MDDWPAPRRQVYRRGALVLCAAPVLILALLAWSHRWTSDDGFINLRVVEQLLAGNGPVFNAGERVEIATSPAWIAVLLAASRVLFFIRLEWVAALLGIALSVSGVVMAMLGSARLLEDGARRSVLFPAGMAVFVALPPVWDFATSGLESSLGVAWLAASFWALACTATGSRRRLLWIACLIGLGPVVRPDFAIFSVAFLLAYLVIVRPRCARALTGAAAAAAAVPVGYQVFRMGYYASLVPNTALAKEAARSNWGQGLAYLNDFAGAYVIWFPLAVLALVAVVGRSWGLRRPTAVVATAASLAGVAHWLYVVRVGGDFMHGRLLLPGLFAMVLPLAVVPLRRLNLLCVLVLPWALIAVFHIRPGYLRDGIFSPAGVVDERLFYVHVALRPHPVTIDDYDFWASYGRVARSAEEAGQRVVFLDEASFTDPGHRAMPKAETARVVVAFRTVGMLSYAAGPRVWVVDLLGLGDPIASREILVRRGRPGHEKTMDVAWMFARFVPPDEPVPFGEDFARRVAAARRALDCQAMRQLLGAVEDPLSPSRFIANLRYSVSTRNLRFDGDPRAAEKSLC